MLDCAWQQQASLLTCFRFWRAGVCVCFSHQTTNWVKQAVSLPPPPPPVFSPPLPPPPPLLLQLFEPLTHKKHFLLPSAWCPSSATRHASCSLVSQPSPVPAVSLTRGEMVRVVTSSKHVGDQSRVGLSVLSLSCPIAHYSAVSKNTDSGLLPSPPPPHPPHHHHLPPPLNRQSCPKALVSASYPPPPPCPSSNRSILYHVQKHWFQSLHLPPTVEYFHVAVYLRQNHVTVSK